MIAQQATKIVQLFNDLQTTGGSTSSATFDTVGYDYVSVRVSLSAYRTVTQNTNPTIALQHSDTTDATNYSTVVANYGGDGTVKRQYLHHIDRRSALKRYVKLSVTNSTAGTDNAMALEGSLILSRAEREPASTNDMTGNTSNDTVVII